VACAENANPQAVALAALVEPSVTAEAYRFSEWLSTHADWAGFAALLFALLLLGGLEALAPAFKHSPERGGRWPANFGLMLLNWSLASMVPLSALGAAELARGQGVGFLNRFSVPDWAAALVTVLAYSLTTYLVHLVSHKSAALWRVHRVHHLDTHLDISTAGRHHPLEIVVLLAISVPVALTMGLQPVILTTYLLLEALISAISHANVRLPEKADRLLRLLVVTPNMHSIHHSAHYRETDSNFGDVLTIWDRLFGTYREVSLERYDEMVIGLKEVRDERASDFWWQLRSPLLSRLSPAAPSTSAAAVENASAHPHHRPAR
jgi:sterol desaturase/sphingolipid hydroxylase (fatty acid hydroxylase superfamily)